MKIGIDISQLAYEKTGVANYLRNLVENLLKVDQENEYVLFFSSLRKTLQNSEFRIKNYGTRVKIREYKFPPSLLDFFWNKLHVFPIEWFIGDVDVFISSDWVEPPVKNAIKATILYDLIVYKYPKETDEKIVVTHKRKLFWAKKECSMFFCISEATKKDAQKILRVEESKLQVIYPGI